MFLGLLTGVWMKGNTDCSVDEIKAPVSLNPCTSVGECSDNCIPELSAAQPAE